jgi:hypothetical protein
VYWRFYNRRWGLILKAPRLKVQRADEYRERVRKMSDASLDTIIQKHIGLSEKQLQDATWEEIDAMAQKRHGIKPPLQRSPLPFYAGSLYVRMERLGDLEESRKRWDEIR